MSHRLLEPRAAAAPVVCCSAAHTAPAHMQAADGWLAAAGKTQGGRPGVCKAWRICQLDVRIGQVLALRDGKGLAAHEHDEEDYAQREHVHGSRVRPLVHHVRGNEAR